MNEYQLARNLAVFSLGLGLAEVLAPRKVAQLIGISEDHENTLRLFGLREIASGLGIMQGKPAYFLWSRVVGDLMDLAFLRSAMKSRRTNERRVQGAMAAVVGVTVLDIMASVAHSRDYSEPTWRDGRPMQSRGAISREDPIALRASADEAMSKYQSGHVSREEGEDERRQDRNSAESQVKQGA